MSKMSQSDSKERERSLGEEKWDRQDEMQPVMARLAARWRRSNLVILVTFRKGRPSG